MEKIQSLFQFIIKILKNYDGVVNIMKKEMVLLYSLYIEESIPYKHVSYNLYNKTLDKMESILNRWEEQDEIIFERDITIQRFKKSCIILLSDGHSTEEVKYVKYKIRVICDKYGNIRIISKDQKIIQRINGKLKYIYLPDIELDINDIEENKLVHTELINIINGLKNNLCSLFNEDFTVYDRDFVMSLSVFSIHKLYLLKLRYNYYSSFGYDDKANEIYEKILQLDNNKNILKEKVKETIYI